MSEKRRVISSTNRGEEMNEVVAPEELGARDLMRATIEKYEKKYPTLLSNYTLAMLLALKEIGVFVPNELLSKASRNELPKFPSLDRAFRDLKTEYETKKRDEAIASGRQRTLGLEWEA